MTITYDCMNVILIITLIIIIFIIIVGAEHDRSNHAERRDRASSIGREHGVKYIVWYNTQYVVYSTEYRVYSIEYRVYTIGYTITI